MIISRRLLYPTLIVLALVMILLALFFFQTYRNTLQNQETSQLNNLNLAFQSELKSMDDLTLALAQQVSNNLDVQTAFASQDREQLSALTLNPFIELSTRHNLAHMDFHTPPATLFLSLSDPFREGEDESLTRLTILTANTVKTGINGIELGLDGLNVWGVAPIEATVPVEEKQEYVGSVAIGKSIDKYFFQKLELEYRTDWQLLINRQRAEKAGAYNPDLAKAGPIPELFLETSTLGTEPVFAEPDAYTQALRGETIFSVVRSGDMDLAVMSFPLRDFSGDVVAVIDILSDRSALVNEAQNRLITALLIIIGGSILAGALLVITSTRVLGPIQEINAAASAIAKGDLDRELPIRTRKFAWINLPPDEVEMLTQSFNSMTIQLRGLVGNLEDRVKARTYDIEHRSAQLRAAAEIGREVTRIRELDQLLNSSINLIRQHFGFYHVGIFLLDERGEYAVLQAATGEAGRLMLQRGHRLRVGQVGIVGSATGTGQPRVALNVDEDMAHFKNPLLPETRSEMALPMRVGERIIGALDVQSQEPAAFDQDDITILQTIADQLAIAIENTHLIQELNETVSELEQAYGKFTQASWYTFTHGRKTAPGYVYQSNQLLPIQGSKNAISPQARQALEKGQVVILEAEKSSEKLQVENTSDQAKAKTATEESAADQSRLAVPIKLRDQVIGVLDLSIGAKSVSPEIRNMVGEAASRLALVLESARLLQEAQRLALREQQINWIASRVRGSVNLDTILQNTVRELGRSLGAARTYIQIGGDIQTIKKSDLNDADGPDGNGGSEGNPHKEDRDISIEIKSQDPDDGKSPNGLGPALPGTGVDEL
jgi:GAF domain-containing protein/HAMP domain-containing protein